jgi:hypothetical protein
MIKEIINFGVQKAKKIIEIQIAILTMIKVILIKIFLFPLLLAKEVPASIMKILNKLKILKMVTKIH